MNREELEKWYGEVFTTDQVRDKFVVHSFMAPECLVTRKSDNQKGLLSFQHSPRFYFNFVAM